MKRNDDLTNVASGCGAVIGSWGCSLIYIAVIVTTVVLLLRWLGVL